MISVSKTSKINLAFLFICFLFFFQNGLLAQWSGTDKKRFYKEMEAVPELENFGENKSRWLECYLSKCEKNYSSFAKANSDAKGCEKLAMDCTKEIYANGSVKGKWSEADKTKFYADMQAVEELNNLGDNKDKWIDCYFYKLQKNFESYFAANSDQAGCEKLAVKCNEEINK